MAEQNLKEKIKDFVYTGIKTTLKAGLVTYIVCTWISNNGCMDSKRTKQALYDSEKPTNTVKIVRSVEEDLEPHFHSGHYLNPEAIRKITFEDGSETNLHYRTNAWQPMRRWIDGDEFKPVPRERYEVTNDNTLVRKLNGGEK